jgi:hypothetical protein
MQTSVVRLDLTYETSPPGPRPTPADGSDPLRVFRTRGLRLPGGLVLSRPTSPAHNFRPEIGSPAVDGHRYSGRHRTTCEAQGSVFLGHRMVSRPCRAHASWSPLELQPLVGAWVAGVTTRPETVARYARTAGARDLPPGWTQTLAWLRNLLLSTGGARSGDHRRAGAWRRGQPRRPQEALDQVRTHSATGLSWLKCSGWEFVTAASRWPGRHSCSYALRRCGWPKKRRCVQRGAGGRTDRTGQLFRPAQTRSSPRTRGPIRRTDTATFQQSSGGIDPG